MVCFVLAATTCCFQSLQMALSLFHRCAVQPHRALRHDFNAPWGSACNTASYSAVYPLCVPLHQVMSFRESQEWMSGQNVQQEPAFLGGRSAVVWAREYSAEDARRCDCNALQQALSKIPGAKRMVGCCICACCAIIMLSVSTS